MKKAINKFLGDMTIGENFFRIKSSYPAIENQAVSNTQPKGSDPDIKQK